MEQRLIDANALKETVRTHDYILKDCFNSIDKGMFTLGIMYAIDEQPTVDAIPVIRCKDCIYYDPPHIENDGQRYEYSDMPPEAFDPITKEYVSNSYEINIGGRCCRDYECGYSEDKRVFVPETNYCGRAERKEE